MPSKRSVAALKQTFLEQNQNLSIPKIVDIVNFIEQVSGLNIISQQESILEFYNAYSIEVQNNSKTPDNFETFYNWAAVIINDFNEIDRNLVDTEKFFEHHKALKSLKYFGEEKSKMIKSYIEFWENLPHYYNALKTHLLNSNQAYQGLAYRKAFENTSAFLSNNNQAIIFLGFNALNQAEEEIFELCLKNSNTKIIWDIDQSFLIDKQHPSNAFIRKYQTQWAEHKKKLVFLDSNHFSQPKLIQILSSPKHVGQAKNVTNILNNLEDNQIEKTAIILSDEDLLNPILNSIPKRIKNVNITMGLALSKSTASNFFNLLINYQNQSQSALNYLLVKQLLNHSVFNHKMFESKSNILSYFEKHNLTKIDYETLLNIEVKNNPIKHLLKCLKKTESPVTFNQNLIMFIDEIFKYQDPFMQNQLLGFKNLLLKLKSTLETYSNFNFSTYVLLFQNLEQTEKLNFKGSKTHGLQIMGVLESRLLDFENIIMTSVNEGILPAGKSDNSYITYNLKKQYGLPTHIEKDAVYAYHFFRLTQRAKQCFFIYDNDQTGFNKGEKSRFIKHLEVFKSANHVINHKIFSLPTNPQRKNDKEIKKTDDVLHTLNKICSNGFSPTALTTYILNPIEFYKKYILHIKEQDSIEKTINQREFGKIMHQTIESLYLKSNPVLNTSIVENFENAYKEILIKYFKTYHSNNEYQSGTNRIQFEIAVASLKRFFQKEKQSLNSKSVKIIDIEKSLETILQIEDRDIKLKGQIDRVDSYGDTLRVIDLKTGKVDSKHLKFKDFKQLISDYDYAKAFQVLFYALVYSKNYKVNDMKAGIISFKNLNSWFMPINFDGNTTIDGNILEQFEIYLTELITEILDPNIPFKEKDVNFES